MKQGIFALRALCALCLVAAAGCGTDAELEWVTPDESNLIPTGDAIELAVTTASPDDRAIRFSIDGVELAVCDPAQPDEDCMRDGVWRWTTTFATPGTYVLTAELVDGDEPAVERTITVLRELPVSALEIDADELAGIDGEPDDLATLEAAGRGYLDPDRAYHSIFGGLSWRVYRQRVRLRSGIPQGSVADVRGCMNRYGASIRRWADYYRISRGSVVATALTESNCTNPAGSSDGLSSGPMQVTGSTCAALTGLSRTTCRSRMHTSPDFSFKVGAMYIGSSYQRGMHKKDPPKIAAAYNAGSLRSTSANRWHMVSTGNHIDRFVRHYNAYRVWEGL